MSKKVGFLGFGIVFGFVLSRVGASEFDLIFGMFTGQNFKLAAVILTAVVIGSAGMQFIKMKKKLTRSGDAIKINRKKLGTWSLLGAALFGIGWGFSGACPGTVLAQVGEGKFFGFFTFAGIIYGTYLYALLKEKIAEF